MKSTHAAAAKMIRSFMKQIGLNGSVKSRTFAGGTAVDVTVIDPSQVAFSFIKEYASRFEYGHYDGMTDCYNYSNRRDDLPQVKYVHVRCEWSTEFCPEPANC